MAVGTPDCCVVVEGGFPLAGNLHAVKIAANITSDIQVKMNFLFIVLSFDAQHSPGAVIPLMNILHHFDGGLIIIRLRKVAAAQVDLCRIYPYRGTAF